jgi:hypothetical protein
MISFCVTSKDRSVLFYRCVQSLLASTDVPAELIVADWGSHDRLGWLPRMIQGTCLDYTLLQLPSTEPFSRGRGLNSAARVARYSCLFFIDTDMIFCSAVVRQALDAVRAGSAYFPICWSYTQSDHSAGRWRDNGKGIVAVPRHVYRLVNEWDEYQQWGSEDVKFYQRVSACAPIIRARTNGLFHQWHVTNNSLGT